MADKRLSKKLSYLLRHGANEVGLCVNTAGYARVQDVLRLQDMRRYTVQDIERVVAMNDKQRFTLKQDEQDEALYIRANQGHTLPHIDPDQLLERIKDPALIPVCIHGTYIHHMASIMKRGLCRMKRNHIHFAMGEVDDGQVISGMRKSVQVKIYLDVEKAMNDGILFYKSSNNVILSPGNDEGIINPMYFKRIVRMT